MKILVIAHYHKDGSPTAIFVHNQLLEYQKLGHEILVVVPIALGKKAFSKNRFLPLAYLETVEGIQHLMVRYLSISRIGVNWFNPFSVKSSMFFSALKTIRNFNPDIIHAHTFGIDSELGSLLKKLLKKKLVVTTHGSDTTLLYRKGKKKKLASYACMADEIVCVSSKLKKLLIECGVKTPIEVISNGFNSDYVDKLMSTPHEQNPKKSSLNSYVINQTCNLVYSKQVDVTLKAFERLTKNYNNIYLTIVGDGPLKEKLSKLCRDLLIDDKVAFKGRLANEKALELMATSDFFIMPSINEGQGVVYLEAMSAGCLTIGTRGEGIEDIIRNNENGFLVKPGDFEGIAEIVSWCIKNPREMKKISELGQKTAQEYTWKKNAMRYDSLFKRLQTGGID